METIGLFDEGAVEESVVELLGCTVVVLLEEGGAGLLLDDGADDVVLVSVSDIPVWLVVTSVGLLEESVEPGEPGTIDPPLQLGTADS